MQACAHSVPRTHAALNRSTRYSRAHARVYAREGWAGREGKPARVAALPTGGRDPHSSFPCARARVGARPRAIA
jgi:hypothetical protein